jgi:16S rRNA (guanine527-N7)-methyltransferase
MEDDELRTATRAAAELGLSPPALRAALPFPGSEHRQLAVVVKESPTPDRYPRRTGVALKRPLGAADAQRG